MIIIVRNQASREERLQLATLLSQLIGDHKPITTIKIDEREVVVFDDNHLDASAQSAILHQSAVERLVQVDTPYQLISRAFKAESSSILVGDASNCQTVTLGGLVASPVIIA